MWRRRSDSRGYDVSRSWVWQPLDRAILGFLARGAEERQQRGGCHRDMSAVGIALVGGGTCTFAELDAGLARLESGGIVEVDPEGNVSLTKDGRRLLDVAGS